MSLITEEVTICNQALDRIGSTNFTYTVQTGVTGIKCNTHYEQTRRAVIRSFEWNFASARKILSAETSTPDFEWDYQYKLPSDFLRMKGLYSRYDFEIEGDLLLTNDTEVEIRYIKDVTIPADFDPLFTEVLVLTLAKKLINPLAGTKTTQLKEDVLRDLNIATVRARAVCRAESEDRGRSSWNLARYGSGIISS